MRTLILMMASGPSLLLAGCSGGTPRPVAGAVPVAQVALPGAPADDRATSGLIAPADILSVTVYREPDVSLASVPVALDGTIQVPLLGNVLVTGYTADQVSRRLTTGFKRFLVRPEVAVNIVSSPTRTITVEGAVTQPGIYPYLPHTSLLSVIAQSRGLTRVAQANRVAVFRTNADGRYLALFDVDAIRGGQAADLALQPGDTVVVGSSGRRQLWQDFLQAAPLLGIFARI